MPLGYFKFYALIASLLSFPLTSALAGPLHEAAERGDIAQIKHLLNKGANVNAKERFDYTALHWAASRGETDAAKLLLVKGANIHAKG